MKKNMLVVVFCVGCVQLGGESNENPNNLPTTCSGAEEGLSRCGVSNVIDTCLGGAWVATNDCAANGNVCTPVSGVAVCQAAVGEVGEGLPCGPNVATCESGLTCATSALLGIDICLQACTDNSTCDTANEEYCEIDGGFFNVGFCTPGANAQSVLFFGRWLFGARYRVPYHHWLLPGMSSGVQWRRSRNVGGVSGRRDLRGGAGEFCGAGARRRRQQCNMRYSRGERSQMQ